MTGNKKKERVELARLADVLVEDILNTSDADILAEFKESHGDPERNATEMLALFEKSLLMSNKKKLAVAKIGAAANRRPLGAPVASSVDIQTARAWLRAAINAPNLPEKLTLAARKESELSDTDVLGMLEDLRELGVIPPDDDKGSKR